MNALLLAAALAVGSGDVREGATDGRTAEEALPTEGRIVITTLGSVDDWVTLPDGPPDFSYVPAAMGHGPVFGLGLALARPGRGIVVSGDGHLLTGLATLALRQWNAQTRFRPKNNDLGQNLPLREGTPSGRENERRSWLWSRRGSTTRRSRR